MDLEAAVSSSSDRLTPSSSTVHHLNCLVLEPTEWMIVVDERAWGFVGAGAERHTLEKWFSLPQR